MFYGGLFGFTTQIGRATSQDGITWTKYNDPKTAEPPFHESDPVVIPEGGWGADDVNRPEVVLPPEGWLMFHMGNQLITRSLSLSDDGIHWIQHPDNPIITNEHFPDPNTITWDTAWSTMTIPTPTSWKSALARLRIYIWRLLRDYYGRE